MKKNIPFLTLLPSFTLVLIMLLMSTLTLSAMQAQATIEKRLFEPSQQLSTSESSSAISLTAPAKLAIYYGSPKEVNSANDDLAQAAGEFATFDLLVLADGLQHPNHVEYTETLAIISQLMLSGTAVYGYVDMGVTSQNLPLATAQDYVDEWQTMGVAGIFWAHAGYEYGVDRVRQNSLIDYTHGQSLTVFINAWQASDVFSDTPTTTHLQAGDWYLAESHPLTDGTFADLDFWWQKSQELATYRAQTGVKIATMSTGNDGYTGWANQDAFRQPLWATYLFGFDAFGFTNPAYSATDASGSQANRLRLLPDVVTDVGSTFLGAPVATSATTYTRQTDKGLIEVFGDSTSGGGIFRGAACDTTTLGNKIWPTCVAAPPAQSSPFGPRQKASEGFRYDWHRGVDIPLPLGEPVYAPMDGIIRIAGNHSAYSDMIVQIRHRETSPYLYSNHLHMLTVTVSADDLVTVGDLIGYSGESSSGFSHIHFEFRDGCLYQDCNRNPWQYLPYTDTQPLTPTLMGANLSQTNTLLLIESKTPFNQLDLEGLELLWGSNHITVAFNEINATTDRDMPYLLDHPFISLEDGVDVCIFPASFNTSSDEAAYRIAFRNLDSSVTTGSAVTLDLAREQSGTSPSLALAPSLPALTVSTANQQLFGLPGGNVQFEYTLQNDSLASLPLTLTAYSAQNNILTLSHTNLTLNPSQSQTITLSATLSADFPAGVGDCILLELSTEATHNLIALNTVVTEPTLGLLDFNVTTERDHILVRWQTITEVGNLGFNLWRSDDPILTPTLLNQSLIPSQAPNSGQGLSYTWQDKSVEMGVTYHYWLEQIDRYGISTHYAPVTATASVPLAVTMGEMGQQVENPWRQLLALSLLVMIMLVALWLRTFFYFIQRIRNGD